MKVARAGRSERTGFEPARPFGRPVFKTGAIDHSATSPQNVAYLAQDTPGIASIQ